MKRFFADQCVSEVAIARLKEESVDIFRSTDWKPGAPDEEVLAKARRMGRILVTHDKDFGELVVKHRLAPPPGIILLRLDGDSPKEDTERIVSVLKAELPWTGHLSVVTGQSVRMRPLRPARP